MTELPTSVAAKAQARRLRRALAERGDDPGHATALELIARTHGLTDWNTYAALAPDSARAPSSQSVTPILRVFDWDAARGFYLDYLGWSIDWEHRFADHLPLYAQVSSPDGARLHLSEHHGDGTPGTAVLIEVADIVGLHAALDATAYRYARPGLEDQPWARTVTVHDPFGNRVTFQQTHARVREPGRVPDQLPPIITAVRVEADPATAFARFTSFGWWRSYGLDPDGQVVIENGEVIFRNPGGDLPIGTITAWEPGRRYAQTFSLAQDPDHPTALEVIFTPDRTGTAVRLEHGGWNATNADRRGHFTDWPIILAHFTSWRPPSG